MQYCAILQEENEMFEEKISAIGKALANPTRVWMLQQLQEGEKCGCEFVALGLDASIVSRYFTMLAWAGLVTSRRDGVRVLWRLTDSSVLELLERLAELATAEGLTV